MTSLTNYGKSLVVLVIGTVFSLLVSVIIANQFDSPYQYVIGILSEVGVIMLSLGVFVYEINTMILSSLRDKDIFIAAGNYAINSKDPSFLDKYKTIKYQLTELAKGHYEIEDLPSVYADDIESIKALSSGDMLYSMCPIGGSSDEVKEQFANKSYTASMSEHYSAIKKNVNVQRLYIFKEASLYKDVEVSKNHLIEAKNNGVDVRLIFLDNPSFKDAKRLPHDFIIFGNHKVSIGRVGPKSRVDGADVWASRDKIEEYRQKYEQLVRQSVGFNEEA